MIEPSHTDAPPLRACSRPRRPSARDARLFVADWDNVLMLHFALDADQLQSEVPFELDTRDGVAFVTLVGFTMRGMRLAFGGCLTSWMFRPLITHDFLNVRTYVRVGGDVGIHFLAEWVSNRVAVALGPRTYSLPYRHGRIRYRENHGAGELEGRVEDAGTGVAFAYQASWKVGSPLSECDPGSLEEWLMERYLAFNSVGGRRRYFRVWHKPWRQCMARVEITEAALLDVNWDWFRDAEFAGANYSPCLRNIGLGWPLRLARED